MSAADNQRETTADNKQAILSLFAKRLRYWRRERGLSLKVLAEKAGISETTIVDYEQARKTPGIDKLFSIAVALNCNIEDLLGVVPQPDLQKQWRIIRCCEVARKIGYDASWNDEDGMVYIGYTDKGLSLAASGQLPAIPMAMKDDLFINYFELIAEIAVSRADLRRITEEVIPESPQAKKFQDMLRR